MTSVWILLLTFSALCTEISWDEYKIEHQLSFNDVEEDLRRKIFEENVQKIEAENAMGHSYMLGINHFAHWTQEEINSMFMTPKQINDDEELDKVFEEYSVDDEETLLEEEANRKLDVDWRRNGYVTQVKDQGSCGSSYSFGTTANLESARAMKKKVLEDLSAQQLVDCGPNYGCRGGKDVTSYLYLTLFGSMTWASYPYKGKKQSCKYLRSKVVVKPKLYVHVKGGRDKNLVTSITKRPTTVRLHANVQSFLFYKSGTYNSPLCTPDVVDHLAIVVGVVKNSTDNYYILKNSWGTSWGMEGYMHVSKARKNPCGIASYPTYVVMPLKFT